MVTTGLLIGVAYVIGKKVKNMSNRIRVKLNPNLAKTSEGTTKKETSKTELKIKSADKLMDEFPGGFESKMSRKEAARILSLKASATPKEVKFAHRKLMAMNHPDTGGFIFRR